MNSQTKPRVAIIGSGISGLTAAYRLHNDVEVTVFEQNDWIGGHTHTVDV
ncbi:MAG: FAD-dependent oxidoreductase, partial [Gammaproteobacteria bacterium]|nr:FAD-dependent oxidoreductase [Gammaproteobacteria bacterium]